MAKTARMNAKRLSSYRQKCKEYTKFLKDDFDFDWTYILLLLRYKLQRTRRCIAKGYTSDRDKIADEIRQVEELIWKVVEHNYRDEAFAAFEKKHGKVKMVTESMRREHLKLYGKATASQKADLKKAFDIMLENIWKWWD